MCVSIHFQGGHQRFAQIWFPVSREDWHLLRCQRARSGCQRKRHRGFLCSQSGVLVEQGCPQQQSEGSTTSWVRNWLSGCCWWRTTWPRSCSTGRSGSRRSLVLHSGVPCGFHSWKKLGRGDVLQLVGYELLLLEGAFGLRTSRAMWLEG